MDISKLKKMRDDVKGELKHIPKGDFWQNQLRQVYWGVRMNSLGKKAQIKYTKEEALRESIGYVKKNYSSFIPQYDKIFFKIQNSAR